MNVEGTCFHDRESADFFKVKSSTANRKRGVESRARDRKGHLSQFFQIQLSLTPLIALEVQGRKAFVLGSPGLSVKFQFLSLGQTWTRAISIGV